MLDHEIIGKFKEFQEKTGKYSDLKIEDVEFEIKRISSKNPNDLICEKRMGFTPKRDKNGDIYWFTVNDLNNNSGLIIDIPQTKEKTTNYLIKEAVDKNNTGKSEKLIPIKKGDVLVSFKLTVGVVKIYNSNVQAYCNEAIDILHIKEGYFNKYIAYNCMIEYPLYGTKTNNGITLNEADKEKIKIYIPKDLNEKYTSYKLQEVIVEFLEWGFAEADKIKENIDKRADILKRAKKCLIPSVFKKDYVKRTFGKYAKENGLDYNITDVEFEGKKLEDISKKIKAGATPATKNKNYWTSIDDEEGIPWLDIDRKDFETHYINTFRKKISKEGLQNSSSWIVPINSIMITIGGSLGFVALNQLELCTNQNILNVVLDNKEYEARFIMYYLDYFYDKNMRNSKEYSNLSKTSESQRVIPIPKTLNNYTSLEIQKHIADFIDHYINIIEKEEDRVNKAYDAVERLKKVYLNRTFRLINWEKNNE